MSKAEEPTWLEKLQAMQQKMQAETSGTDEAPEAVDEPDSSAGRQPSSGALRQKEPLHIIYERKGRGGKPATIITGFTISDEEIADIASLIKKRLASGGSSRGGEILIQGDRRQALTEILRSLGFRCK